MKDLLDISRKEKRLLSRQFREKKKNRKLGIQLPSRLVQYSLLLSPPVVPTHTPQRILITPYIPSYPLKEKSSRTKIDLTPVVVNDQEIVDSVRGIAKVFLNSTDIRPVEVEIWNSKPKWE